MKRRNFFRPPLCSIILIPWILIRHDNNNNSLALLISLRIPSAALSRHVLGGGSWTCYMYLGRSIHSMFDREQGVFQRTLLINAIYLSTFAVTMALLWRPHRLKFMPTRLFKLYAPQYLTYFSIIQMEIRFIIIFRTSICATISQELYLVRKYYQKFCEKQLLYWLSS